MGCWSESCAISGLEIGSGDEAVAVFLRPVSKDSYYEHGAFCRFVPTCFPTYGYYSDYGDIETPKERKEQIDNKFFLDQFEAGRRSFDPKKDDHMKYMANLWWCRKDVWDFCDSIPLEFSYGENAAKTVGALIEKNRASINDYVNEQIELKNAVVDEETRLDRLMRNITTSRDLFGIGRLDGDLVHRLKRSLDDAIEAGDRKPIDNIIEAALRILKMSSIGHELRRIMCPNTRVGPQHGGYEAQALLATFTLTKCQEHFSEYGECDDGDED